MKLARIGPPGHERPAILDAEGRLRDLSAHVADIGQEALSQAELQRLAAIDVHTLAVIEAPVRYGPPVAEVGKIICIGLNYTDHAAEVGLPVPTEPTVFIKASRPSGANDTVRLPKGAEKGDWEVELAIVIGKGGLYIEEDDALDHVAGYCLFHDVSERSYQMERGGQWTKGKSFPGFAPLGPWLVTTDEIGDPGDLGIWLEVNGERHQDGSTRNLVFGVRRLVSYLSRFFALEPGDVIATGTPAGVGLGLTPPRFLKGGDTVRLGIDGLGVQAQRILAWEDPR
ncbi:2-hydroxyhepta-2,4-diene-1,7-dioate isomerase [Caulobacter radicis]|uniref:fumarylacetoacetate hydrolase family protein n=1 Tax=Caulobacter radicis TaxID=2172650 RepID=UPI000D57FBA4|nr:fumarylacetoacetate hydrolase family protein [Caulobacter radicis]PVM88377.1 2-hydroxyhepta-2,4-diene-1,7-dioate isomerase [Caulobacter radicis]